MIDFIIGLFIGTISGISAMCILQINRYETIEKDSSEEK